MTDLPAFSAGMLFTVLLVLSTCWRYGEQREQMLRTMTVIILNWFAGIVYVSNTENPTPWHYNIFIDAAAAIAVMYHPAGRVQGYIGLFYFFQISAHVAFGARRLLGIPTDEIFYYDAITYVAWAQLAALGVWCGGVWLADLVHRFGFSGDAPHNRAGHFNLGGKTK